MFRLQTTRIAHRISDVLDEMLLGDFEYVETTDGIYADVDFHNLAAAQTAGSDFTAATLARRSEDDLCHPHRKGLRAAAPRRGAGPECQRLSAAMTACAPGRLARQWETTSNPNAAI